MADAELNKLFAAAGKELEPDVLGELRSTMRLHDLSPQDLFYKWESYCLRMEIDGSDMTILSARALKKDVLDALERQNRAAQAAHLRQDKRSAATPRGNIKGGGGSDVFGM